MMIDNSFYGHRHIFEKYCKIEKNQNAFAAIQHGWLSTNSVKIIEPKFGSRRISIYPFLCWSKKIEKILIQNKLKNIKSIGAPFLYLHEIIDKKKNHEQGTLVFPSKCHFGKFNPNRINHKDLIDFVEKNYEPPFSVAIFFDEFKNEIIKHYKERNWRLINFGQRLNKNFLHYFYSEVMSSKNVIFNTITSPFFYCCYLKKNARILCSIDDTKKLQLINDYYNTEKEDEINYAKNFNFIFKDGNINEKYDLACMELGYESIINKENLKNILGWNNIIKKYSAKFYYYYSKSIHKFHE